MGKLATIYHNDQDIEEYWRAAIAKIRSARGSAWDSVFCVGLRFCINSVNTIRAERKERKQCEIDQAAKSLFCYKAEYFGFPLHYTRFTFDVSVTRACITRVYLWIDARSFCVCFVFCVNYLRSLQNSNLKYHLMPLCMPLVKFRFLLNILLSRYLLMTFIYSWVLRIRLRLLWHWRKHCVTIHNVGSRTRTWQIKGHTTLSV